MGASIVYGNLNRLVICTQKINIEDAATYTNFVVDTIANKELFHCIDVKFKDCWQYLMWLGPVSLFLPSPACGIFTNKIPLYRQIMLV